MIETEQMNDGWRWHWLSAAGRRLWTCDTRFPCNVTAFADARRMRSQFWSYADEIDHRQARCI